METLTGLRFRQFKQVFTDNIGKSHGQYWPDYLKLLMLSLRNSVLARQELRHFEQAILATEIKHPPVFVLGHWRSGTSLLHKLLAFDEQFAYPNMLETYNPWTFLSLEPKIRRYLDKLEAAKRPMDNMMIRFSDPAEDEFGLSLLSLKSPVLAWAFPAREEFYERYLTLLNISEKEADEWAASMVYFLKKLTLKYNKTLLLKSPQHTARIKTLLRHFPEARFIHLIRNPYEVYRSTEQLYQHTVSHLSMQHRDSTKDRKLIIQQYKVMYEAYLADRALLRPGQLCELRFEDFEQDKAGQIRKIYETLQLDGWPAYEPVLQKWLENQAPYKKNEHPKLNDESIRQINTEWAFTFNAFGYPLQQ